MYLLHNEKTYVSIYLCHCMYVATPTPTPTSTPMPPSKVQGVTVTRSAQGPSPALSVSWSAVSGSGITYTVCYSTTSGTQSDPPSGADCGTRGITGTSTTLGSLSGGTTYYIWVAAVSSGGRGPYSDRRQEKTYRGEQSQGNYMIHLAYTVDIEFVNLPQLIPQTVLSIPQYTGLRTIINNYSLKHFIPFRRYDKLYSYQLW